MKKFLSTILAVVMVLSSMAMVVSAEETLADGIYVGTTKYDTFTAAQTAAAETTAKEIIISGTVEFGSRQAISVDGIHLRGINDAKIVPSASFGNSTSETNKKALLNFQANNLKATDIVFDGGDFGDSIDMSLSNILTGGFIDFVVVRVNSGSVEFDNVTIEGSKKSLLSIGTSTTSAVVNATELYCNADSVKSVVNVDGYKVFPDVDVVKGTFNMTGGMIDGLVVEDEDYAAENTLNVTAAGLYTFTGDNVSICANAENFSAAYVNSSLTFNQVKEYAAYITENVNTSNTLVTDVIADIANMEITANNLVTMFNDMLNKKSIFGTEYAVSGASARAQLEGYVTQLETALGNVAE